MPFPYKSPDFFIQGYSECNSLRHQNPSRLACDIDFIDNLELPRNNHSYMARILYHLSSTLLPVATVTSASID